MKPTLAVVCTKRYEPSLGPMGYNGSWSGQLAVRTDGDAIVKLGIQVSASSYSDYSGSSGGWYVVKLHETTGGWLLKVMSMSMEMGVGEWVDSTERWLGSADGRTWRKLDDSDQVAEGALVDELSTPASDRTIYEP